MPKATPKANRKAGEYRPGDSIRVKSGLYAGRTGTVDFVGCSGLVYFILTGTKCLTYADTARLEPLPKGARS